MSLAVQRVHVEAPSEAEWPLEAGDHLDRETFHARYAAMPPGIKAELINGVVFMPSPVTAEHGSHHAEVMAWLIGYKAQTPGVRVIDNGTVRLGDASEPQPDASLLILPEYGGQSRRAGSYIQGAPELVVEVTASTASYDLHEKLECYKTYGVREYVVVLLRQQTVSWFANREVGFEATPADEAGICRSEVFPGLWLDTTALMQEDSAALQATLRQGLDSPEHAQFVQRLADARKEKE